MRKKLEKKKRRKRKKRAERRRPAGEKIARLFGKAPNSGEFAPVGRFIFAPSVGRQRPTGSPFIGALSSAWLVVARIKSKNGSSCSLKWSGPASKSR